MTNNREKRIYQENVHLYMALQRTSKQGNKNCIRTVIKDEELDLKFLEAKLKVIGGEWRIHHTVNARNVEKARIWLIKHLLDYPKNASFTDSAWRTALLQKECKETNYFMLDVDTKDLNKFDRVLGLIKVNFGNVIKCVATPNGYHIMTDKFDTREVCKLDYVTLLRDGYYYIKTVNGEYNGIRKVS